MHVSARLTLLAIWSLALVAATWLATRHIAAHRAAHAPRPAPADGAAAPSLDRSHHPHEALTDDERLRLYLGALYDPRLPRARGRAPPPPGVAQALCALGVVFAPLATDVRQTVGCRARSVGAGAALPRAVIVPDRWPLRVARARQGLPRAATPHAERPDVLVWRGLPPRRGADHARAHSRDRLVERLHAASWADIAFAPGGAPRPARLVRDAVAEAERFASKATLLLEGPGFVTDLCAAMASGCVVLMPRPTVDSWLCESRLVPHVHYVPVAEDFGDLRQRYATLLAHPALGQRIADGASAFIAQFLDPGRETRLWRAVLRALHRASRGRRPAWATGPSGPRRSRRRCGTRGRGAAPTAASS